MICNFPLLFSHSKNIRMSTLITIIITCYLLIITIIISTKSHNNYCSVGVMELYLLNLLIMFNCFLCNSYPCVLFESFSHVINQELHVIREISGKFTSFLFLRFQNFKKVNSVNLSQISLLSMWLPVLTLSISIPPTIISKISYMDYWVVKKLGKKGEYRMVRWKDF